MAKEKDSAREAKRRLLQILHKNRIRRNPDSEEESQSKKEND